MDGYINKTYVGYTSNLNKRLILHNSSKGAKFTRGRLWKLIYKKKHNSSKGAKSTRGYKWKIIYKKRFLSKSKALSFEYNLKKDRKKRLSILKELK